MIYFNAYDANPESWELYDLNKDPHETNNLYAQVDYKNVVEEMKSKLKNLRIKYEVNNNK